MKIKITLLSFIVLFSNVALSNIEKEYVLNPDNSKSTTIVRVIEDIANGNVKGLYVTTDKKTHHFVGVYRNDKLQLKNEGLTAELSKNKSGGYLGVWFNGEKIKLDPQYNQLGVESITETTKGVSFSHGDSARELIFQDYEFMDYSVSLVDYNFDAYLDLVIKSDFSTNTSYDVHYYNHLDGLFNNKPDLRKTNLSINFTNKIVCSRTVLSREETEFEIISLERTKPKTKIITVNYLSKVGTLSDGNQKTTINEVDYNALTSECYMP